MLLRHEEAILLDVFDLHERDRIVTFLTPGHGKKRGVARGSRTKFSRFAGQLQPLAKVRIRWAEKEGRDLVRISEVETLRPAAPLQQELEGILVCAYLAEHMTEFAQEEEPSDRLFRLLDSTVQALLDGLPEDATEPWGVSLDLAARYVEIWTLRLAGVLPVPRLCPLCGRPLGPRSAFLEEESAITCLECSEGHRRRILGSEELIFLARTGHESLPRIARGVSAPPPSSPTLREVESLTAAIRRNFLQAELKSYRVLRDTLGV